MKTKFAIGCLIQWYESDIIEEYADSLQDAIDAYDGEVIVDFTICRTQKLEKCISLEQRTECCEKIRGVLRDRKWFNWKETGEIHTIADYRREFNTKYCDEKCKILDNSWKPLEHTLFTDKRFIENDYDNWWSLKYTMNKHEMNNINDKTDELDVRIMPQHKFNGCGLVISSEVIRAGVNIPKSVFFVHEDSAFMFMTNKILGNIPQYVIKNILLVHNRNHPNKRMYIKGETGDTLNKKRRSNDWYVKANKMCEENYINLFNPNYKSWTWEDVL